MGTSSAVAHRRDRQKYLHGIEVETIDSSASEVGSEAIVVVFTYSIRVLNLEWLDSGTTVGGGVS